MKRLRRKPCINLSPIYFLVEEHQRVYRCDCGAREFQIGAETNGYTRLTCSYRKSHVVISGFTVGEPDYERETAWLTDQERLKFAKAIQLPLLFSEWLQIGKISRRVSRWLRERKETTA